MNPFRTSPSISMPLVVSCLALAIGFSGCDSDQVFSKLGEEWDAAAVILGIGSSEHRRVNTLTSNGRGTREEATAAQAKQNTQILQEVYRDVYAKEPPIGVEFGSLLAAMNQGASIEGIYNGIVHSADFRKLESDHPGATGLALRFFAEELARTELELSSITDFPVNSAQPLSAPVEPTGIEEPESSKEIDYPGPSPSVSLAPSPSPSSQPAAPPKPAERALFQKYYNDFSGASFYTLKRVLGDELVKLCTEKAANGPNGQKDLAKWYGAWVNRMDGLHVDFGLPLRNNPDAEFHQGWATSVSADRLRWEVLNRIHRVINQFEVNK
jgi:hypothetical protein